MVCKIFFCSEFLGIPEKSQRGKKTNSKAIAKRSALQANAIKHPQNKMFKFLTKIIYELSSVKGSISFSWKDSEQPKASN